MYIQPIQKKPTLSDIAYREIRKAIIANSISPGDIFTEVQLSAMLNISRTPVRAALLRLMEDGLIEQADKGITVSSYSNSDARDIATVRSWIEPQLIESLPGKLTDSVLDQLSDYVRQQDKVQFSDPNSYLEYIDLDYQFHTLLAETTKNKYLTDIVRRLNTHSCRFLVLSPSLVSAGKIATKEHKMIVDALRQEDYQLAKSAMNDHIANVCIRLTR